MHMHMHMHMHGMHTACTQHAHSMHTACTQHALGTCMAHAQHALGACQVVKAFDYKEQRMVAIKIIRNKKRFHTQALVEVKILMHIKTHDQDDSANFVQTRGHFYFRSHLCIAFELLSINLYEFIKNNNFQGVSLPLIRRFAIQLLTSLRALRKQRIVHCDLKPENILLNDPGKSAIKMIDFGSSCFEETKVMHLRYTYATPTLHLH